METMILFGIILISIGATWLYVVTRQFHSELKAERAREEIQLKELSLVVETISKSQAAIATEVEKTRADMAAIRIERLKPR
jgi:uncharacterized protein (UPF0333 family)